MYHKIQHELLY